MGKPTDLAKDIIRLMKEKNADPLDGVVAIVEALASTVIVSSQVTGKSIPDIRDAIVEILDASITLFQAAEAHRAA